VIPENSVLLLTCSSKPDGRLKSTQLLQESAYIRNFPDSALETEQLVQQVQQVAQELGKTHPRSAYLVAESVGNAATLQ